MQTPESQDAAQSGTARSGLTRPGLIDSVITVARDAAGLLFNRLELAALELGEVRGALLRLLLVGALGIVAVWFAVAYWTVLIVYLAWDTLGWKILLIVAFVFSLLAWWLLRRAGAIVEEGRLSMPATMAELRSDRDALL